MVYVLKRENVVVKEETASPTEDTELYTELMIPAHATFKYELEYHFKNFDYAQDQQKGKSYKAKINIDEAWYE